MRFIAMIKSDAKTEAGQLPTAEQLTAMARYNEELEKAGVMLAGEGLQPSSKGARVRFVGGQKPSVIDGPFAEAKELVAGWWIFQVKSKQEAIDWIKRCPLLLQPGDETTIEIRQIFETEDFPPEVFSPEEAAKERAQRERLE